MRSRAVEGAQRTSRPRAIGGLQRHLKTMRVVLAGKRAAACTCMPRDVLPSWLISLLLALTENIQFLHTHTERRNTSQCAARLKWQTRDDLREGGRGRSNSTFHN